MTRAQLTDTTEDNTDEMLLPNNIFINAMLLPETLFINQEEQETFTSFVDEDLQKEIRNALPNDSIAKQVIIAFKDSKKPFPFKCHLNTWT